MTDTDFAPPTTPPRARWAPSRKVGPVGLIARGARDMAEGARARRLWGKLAWNDIRERYRRSVIGPFWITISMAIFVVLLGFIYAKIFQMDVAVYLPYVAGGLIVWSFISGALMEGCATFTSGSGVIKQVKLPFSIYVYRTVWRVFIVFLHTVVLMVPILAFFGAKPTLEMLLVFPGLFLLVVNQIWLSVVVSVLSTRFRDMVQLIQTAVQISMFATPIMWPVSAVAGATYIANFNPLYHMIEIVRAPLLGTAPPTLSYLVVAGLCAVGYLLAFWLLGRSVHRIVYWL